MVGPPDAGEEGGQFAGALHDARGGVAPQHLGGEVRVGAVGELGTVEAVR